MENNDFIAGLDDEHNLVALDVIHMNTLRHQTIIHAQIDEGTFKTNRTVLFPFINL